MTKPEALEQMLFLLGAAVSGRLSTTEQDWCLERSAVGGDYDPWIAASEAAYLFGGRAMAGQVTRFTADGATFEQKQDWKGWGDWLKSQSPRSRGEGWDDDFAFLIVP